ncbi:unnamed protein product [Nippostrongylus brasiliensis]|uniref:Protein kinase domain-containing protein n=1 Tax=Nippostrongylus brasiliensis TaxID=27835 RepID=A0A0N4YKR9_NIPBR|nr:unnamed protein product [Nippostrongylus brasiliensis]
MDCRVLRGAQQINSCHFCTIEDRGKVEERFIFIVMKLIGSNLWDLRVERESMRFTLNTALKAAEQCLLCIEELHRVGGHSAINILIGLTLSDRIKLKMGFLHRDIKPGNFAIGRPETHENHIIFVLDFGLCRKYQEKDKDVRVPRDSAPFRGTTRYAPIAAMKQLEQSRKDDLEGWMYMVVEWTSGGLPWRKYKVSYFVIIRSSPLADNREEVLKMKEDVKQSEAAMAVFLRNCPEREFKRIMNAMQHVRTEYLYELTYFSIPDYNFVYYCIQHACKANNIKQTDPVDWDKDHEFNGPTGPPGDGKLVQLDDNEEDFEAVSGCCGSDRASFSTHCGH